MKLLCSILVAVLMLSNIAYAEVIDDEKILFQTVIGNDGLKIVDIAEDDVITREEMVDVLINLTQIQNDDIYYNKSFAVWGIIHYTSFDDWQVEENKEELVRRLYECEIIKGCDSKFRPYDACTVEEAITFIVRGLGWNTLAEHAKGYEGYPQGHIKVAEEKELCNSDDINIGKANINQFLSKIIFNSLFVDTLEKDGTAFTQVERFDSIPCALGRYHELGHTYGYATNHESGIKINDVIYQGKVSNNESFDEGYVLCIYDKSNYEAGKSIALCLEISEEIYEKYRDKDISRGRACEIADEFFVEKIGTNFITGIAGGFPEIKETDNAYSIYRSADKLGLYKEGTVVVDKKDGSIISFTAE